MCHWETEQDDFLLLLGAALLIVEGPERPVREPDLWIARRRRATCSSAQAMARA